MVAKLRILLSGLVVLASCGGAHENLSDVLASMMPDVEIPSTQDLDVDESFQHHAEVISRLDPNNIDTMAEHGIMDIAQLFTLKYGTKIVGGANAKRGEFPYQVALKINNGPRQHLFCGGTLISRTWVITAAHCLEWMDGKYENVRVILGEHDLMNEKELTEQDFGIKAVVLHEEYDKWKLWYDIALILLDGVAEFSENVRPINLPKRLETESIGNATISGWGATREGGAASEVLMKAYVPIVPDDRCRSDYEDVEGAEIIASHICAGHERGGIDSCQGDSGGPMVCTERVLQSGRRFFRVLTNDDETEENDRPNQLSKNRWNHTFGSKEVPVVGKKEEDEMEPVETGPYLCGVVSFGAGCGRPGHPGVYTQVSYFLPWLKKSIASFTDHQDGHEESNMATLPTKDFYPFMGMVSYIPIDLLSRKDPVSCVGTLLAENLVLTSADCITPFIEDNEGNSFWVGFGKHVVPGSKHFQRIPVSDWFGFRPDRFLRDIADGGSGDDSSSSKASQSNSANKALVLELAWGLVYDNDAYPVNLPMTKNFTGMRAQLVSLTHKKDKYFFRLKMKPRVGEFELTDLSACGEDSLRVYNLDPQDALCGRMISGTRKCLDFAAGSALICHTNIDRENGTSDSFICGMLARPIDGRPRTDDKCVFRKIYVSELAVDSSDKSNYTLAAIGNPFFDFNA